MIVSDPLQDYCERSMSQQSHGTPQWKGASFGFSLLDDLQLNVWEYPPLMSFMLSLQRRILTYMSPLENVTTLK